MYSVCSKMFRGLLKTVSKVFSFGSGNQDAYGNANARRTDNGYCRRAAGGSYVIHPEMLCNMTKACGRIITFLMAQLTSNKNKTISKESANGLEEAGDDFEFVLMDEGYKSAATSKHFETSNELLKLEEYYNQQRGDVEFDLLKLQHKLFEMKLNCVDDYDDDEEEDEDDDYGYKGKRKGGKRFVKKTCHLEEEERQLKLREKYLNKIKTKKKRLRFQQLDDETQLMICKIDALRETGSDKNFFKKLLKMFEGKSLKVQRLEETVEKMKEVDDNNAKTIDDIIDEHQRILEVKDEEIMYLKKQLEAESRMRAYLIKNNEKRFKKHLKIEDLEDEYQMMFANMEALRKSDNVLYKEVLYMLKELS